MKTNQDVQWQQSAIASYFLATLLVIVTAWTWIISWPLAAAGHQGAVENLLMGFWGLAAGLAFLAVGYRRPKLVTVGGPVWAVAFYLSSLFLDDMVQGHNAGTAIRVGALSVMAFVLAAGWMLRKR